MVRGRGFSKLEFLVVLCILGVVASALLSRLIAVEHETERLEVDLTLRHIDLGLKLAVGECIMRGEEARIAELAERNPLAFLDTGSNRESTAALGRQPDLARWHYYPDKRELTYRVRQPAAFEGRTELHWRFLASRDKLGRTVGLHLETLK